MGRASILIAGAVLLACVQPRDDAATEFGGMPMPSAETSSASSASSEGTGDGPAPEVESSGDATSGDDGDPIKLDVGAAETGSGGEAKEGCQKVDFLFAIDASPSMAAEQAQLLASFPGFIDAIRDTLQAQDYRVLVTDVDAHPQYTPAGGNGFCEDGSCCDSLCTADPLANWCNNEPCGDHAGDCDFTLGAGKDDDENWSSCDLPDGRRWLEGSDADLLDHFECIARVGTYGYFDETQAGAIESAIAPELVGPGGCNEDFLRDDAVLVVTLITDEEDQDSLGDPQDWYDAILERKGGDPDAVVMLGLVGDYGHAGSPCAAYDPEGTGAHDAVRLQELVALFGDRGMQGSVCAADYVPFFSDAVGLIDTACDEFMPEG